MKKFFVLLFLIASSSYAGTCKDAINDLVTSVTVATKSSIELTKRSEEWSTAIFDKLSTVKLVPALQRTKDANWSIVESNKIVAESVCKTEAYKDVSK